jgi:hypothetical protein
MRREQAQEKQSGGRPESAYLQLIREATDAPDEDLTRIEQIMREDVFHSTLDWQSHKQLRSAARRAHRLLTSNRELYDLGVLCKMAMFEKMRAESAVAKEDSVENRAALQAADSKYDSVKAKLLGCRQP